MSESAKLPVTLNDAENKIAVLDSGALGVWSSIAGNTEQGRLDVFDALASAENIDDAGMLDKPFNLKDILVQAVEVADEDGVVRSTLRTILITSDGTALAATSDGLYNSVRNLIQVVGHPSTWSGPLPVIVRRIKGRHGFYFYSMSLFRGNKVEK